MNRYIVAATIAAISSGTTAYVMSAPPDLTAYYHPMVPEDVDMVAVQPSGSCEVEDGGTVSPVLDADGGSTGRCWLTKGYVNARPSVEGLPVLHCEVWGPTSAAEMAVLKGMIRAKVLARCAAKYGLAVAP